MKNHFLLSFIAVIFLLNLSSCQNNVGSEGDIHRIIANDPDYYAFMESSENIKILSSTPEVDILEVHSLLNQYPEGTEKEEIGISKLKKIPGAEAYVDQENLMLEALHRLRNKYRFHLPGSKIDLHQVRNIFEKEIHPNLSQKTRNTAFDQILKTIK